MISIEITEEIRHREEELVLSWFRDYNFEMNGDFMQSLEDGFEMDLIVLAREEETGKVTGSLMGSILHDWLRIDILVVDPERRREGIGKKLLGSAEEFAVEYGCSRSYVDTMSYQSPDFFRKLGYRQAGRLPDWDSHGHDKYFFIKKYLSTGKITPE